MTLKQLEAFYLAATLGSFALAAQRVHVTQSSLSKRIAELEAWVGAELFDRSGQRAHLTDAGHRIMAVAKQMLELKEGVRGALDGPLVLEGACRFGISELGALTWLPSFVARVRGDHPQLVLQPHVDLGRRLERLVVRGELDFAVVAGPADDARVASQPVSEVRFTWTAAPGRLRAGRVLDVSELSKHPVITMTEGSGLTQAFDVWAATHGLRMERIVASNSLMAIIGLTIADMGLSFLPRDYIRPWIDGGALTAFRSRPPLPTLQYCFIHRADDRRALLPTLLRCVTDVAQFSVPAGVSRKTT
jgi:DNA-binding transcriptional LysR family regulator